MDSLDEFMVTLPSNSSMQVCPQNRPSNYTVALEQETQLSGSWEVALVDIQYPHDWFNFRRETDVVCCLSVPEKDRPSPSIWNIDLGDRNASNANAPLHERFLSQVSRFTHGVGSAKLLRLSATFYDGVDEFARYIADSFTNMYTELYPNIKFSYALNRHTGAYEFSVSKGTFVILTDMPFTPQTLGIRKLRLWGDAQTLLTGGVNVPIFAFPDNSDLLMKRNPPKGDLETFPDDFLAGLDDSFSLYIYTDIVKYQIVGEVRAPLLGVAPVQGKHGTLQHWGFNPPYYIPVSVSSLKRIMIKICSDTGEEIKLVSLRDKIVCRLHFRRRNINTI